MPDPQIPLSSPVGDMIEEVEAKGQLSSGLMAKVRAIPEEDFAANLRNSAAELIQNLAEEFAPSQVVRNADRQRTWELIGLIYLHIKRSTEALEIFRKLYYHMLAAQDELGERFHKGTPLCWMADCFRMMGHRVTACRYLMLTVVEDGISGAGKVTLETGAYWRLVWSGLLSEAEFRRYAAEAYDVFQRPGQEGFYPEWVLQTLDAEWITQVPAPQESGVFVANLRYIERLIGRLGDGTGRSLEALANYLLSCMPGCRVASRKRSYSSEYDVVCSVEGLETDFRSELGRYFVCECKDLGTAATVTDLAKFCYVLDSIKSRFGIMFSTHGITGEDGNRYADRERLKVFQNRGIVIVVIDKNDLERVGKGTNFITLMRSKYEKVRLDVLDE
jgi:hypothetical protein